MTPTNASTNITQATLERLFEERLYPQTTPDGAEVVQVSCFFSEGIRCYYLPAVALETFDFREDPETHTPENQLDEDFGKQIVKELDPKSVDRARNNAVVLQCTRSAAGVSCQIDGGPGWQPLGIH